jgi:multiple antibiotic resistance protein
LTIGPRRHRHGDRVRDQLDEASELLTLVPVMLGVCFLVWLGLRFAAPMATLLGDTVISVIIRIMAIILAAIAIEMIVAGVIGAIDQHYPDLGAGGAHAPRG